MYVCMYMLIYMTPCRGVIRRTKTASRSPPSCTPKPTSIHTPAHHNVLPSPPSCTPKPAILHTPAPHNIYIYIHNIYVRMLHVIHIYIYIYIHMYTIIIIMIITIIMIINQQIMHPLVDGLAHPRAHPSTRGPVHTTPACWNRIRTRGVLLLWLLILCLSIITIRGLDYDFPNYNFRKETLICCLLFNTLPEG